MLWWVGAMEPELLRPCVRVTFSVTMRATGAPSVNHGRQLATTKALSSRKAYVKEHKE